MIERNDDGNASVHALLYGTQSRALFVGVAVTSFIVSVALPLTLPTADRPAFVGSTIRRDAR